MNSAWDFWGLSFGPGIFLGFPGSPRDFLGVLIFAPIRSSPSLEIRSTPWAVTSLKVEFEQISYEETLIKKQSTR